MLNRKIVKGKSLPCPTKERSEVNRWYGWYQ